MGAERSEVGISVLAALVVVISEATRDLLSEGCCVARKRERSERSVAERSERNSRYPFQPRERPVASSREPEGRGVGCGKGKRDGAKFWEGERVAVVGFVGFFLEVVATKGCVSRLLGGKEERDSSLGYVGKQRL